jgi:Tfp pilus assembly pilus retraction ATPase PilT
MALKNITFSDVYLGEDGAWLSGVPGTSDPIASPPEDIGEVLSLRKACEAFRSANPDREDFSIRHGDIGYRASVMITILETVFVLRRLSDKVKPIAELGIPSLLVDMMMKPKMTGLFIVSGAFGQGKTTTAASLVVGRISLYGGVAVTIEEPPEIPLHGRHGEGVCYQTCVQKGGFGHACRQAARWAPSIIFLGELRDTETAIEALRASINGKLVVCTAHADNCAMAIERVFNLANGDGSSSDDVLGMLATGLTAVINQRLETSGSRRNPMIESLFLTDEDGPGVRAIIRQRKFDQLKSIIQMQKNRMIVSGRKQIS